MTPIERAAYNAGSKAVINMAQIVAIMIETANDANVFRKRVAVETLTAFAERAKNIMLEAPISYSQPDMNRAPDGTSNLL